MPVDSTKMMTYNRIMISLNINEIKTHSLTIFTCAGSADYAIPDSSHYFGRL